MLLDPPLPCRRSRRRPHRAAATRVAAPLAPLPVERRSHSSSRAIRTPSSPAFPPSLPHPTRSNPPAASRSTPSALHAFVPTTVFVMTLRFMISPSEWDMVPFRRDPSARAMPLSRTAESMPNRRSRSPECKPLHAAACTRDPCKRLETPNVPARCRYSRYLRASSPCASVQRSVSGLARSRVACALESAAPSSGPPSPEAASFLVRSSSVIPET